MVNCDGMFEMAWDFEDCFEMIEMAEGSHLQFQEDSSCDFVKVDRRWPKRAKLSGDLQTLEIAAVRARLKLTDKKKRRE